jgi:hypothetical protein
MLLPKRPVVNGREQRSLWMAARQPDKKVVERVQPTKRHVRSIRAFLQKRFAPTRIIMARHETDRLRKKSFVSLLSTISRARSMDVAELSPEEVDHRIGSIMDGYRTVTITAQMNGLYRARKNIGDEPWPSTADLWYPPATAVLNRGRFNEPGTSVFYACNRAASAIYEIHPNVGDVTTLLVAHSRRAPFAELNCAHIGLERSLAPEIGFVPRNRMLRTNPRFQAMLTHYGISQKWLLVDNFLSEMATTMFTPSEEQDKYKITNSIGRNLFKIPNVHALNYPSVASKLVSLNLCLPPEIADQNFKPAEAWMIRFDEKSDRLPGSDDQEGPYFRTTFVRRSEQIEPDGRICWSDILHDVKASQIGHLTYRTLLPEEVQKRFAS